MQNRTLVIHRLLIGLIFIVAHSSTIAEESDICHDVYSYSFSKFVGSREAHSFDDAVAEYEAGRPIEAARIFRMHALRDDTTSQYNVGFVFEKLRQKDNNFGSFNKLRCESFRSRRGFKDAFDWLMIDSEESDEKAIPILTRLSKEGHALSKYYLGSIYAFIGSHRGNKHYDPAKGAKYLHEALDAGIAEAKPKIMLMLPFALFNECMSKSQRESTSPLQIPDVIIRDIARNSNEECQVIATVLNSTRDTEGASWHFQESSNRIVDCRQLPSSEEEVCYLKVVFDGYKDGYCELARYWYRKAAENNYEKAAFALGEMHLNAEKLVSFTSKPNTCKKRDRKESVKWFQRSAELGNAEALVSLGYIYLTGLGAFDSGSNDTVSADYYQQAAIKLASSGDRRRALEILDVIKSNFPNDKRVQHKVLSAIYGREATNQATPKEKEGKAKISMGTAWMISRNHAVTNYHVIRDHEQFSLFTDKGKKINANLIIHDSANDLAILEIKEQDADLEPLQLTTKAAKSGQQVFTIGYPHPDIMGVSPKFTQGHISSTTGIQDDPRTYQISVPVQSGNSGGPLFTDSGKVIGVVTSKLSASKIFKWTGDLPQNVNYAVKSIYLQALIDTKMSGKVSELSTSMETAMKMEALVEKLKESILMVVAE